MTNRDDELDDRSGDYPADSTEADRQDRGLELLVGRDADLRPEPAAPDTDRRGLELLGEEARTASGLEERQIAAQDLRELQGLLKVRQLSLSSPTLPMHSLAPGVDLPPVREVLLSLSAPRTLKLRLVALPDRARLKALKFETPRLKLQHSLELIQRQPVRRQRILPAELSPAQREALARALFKQYGKAAQGLMPVALFAHVPPELKDGLRLSSDGRCLGILVPRGFHANKASSGTWLVLLEDREAAGAETRRILLRL